MLLCISADRIRQAGMPAKLKRLASIKERAVLARRILIGIRTNKYTALARQIW
jgi:hypothetical protein